MIENMEIKAKFKLDEEHPDVWQFPLVVRERIYNEVKELLPEVDEYLEEHGEAVAIQSEEWPVTYMFSSSDDRIIVILTIYNTEMVRESVLKFNFRRDDMDRLLE